MKISAYARGLLNLVGAQNFGANVAQVNDAFAPIIDCTELLEAEKLQTVQGNAAIVGGTSTYVPTLDVPAGEIWRLRWWTLVCVTAVAETVTNAGLAWRVGGAGGNVLNLTNPMSLIASQTSFQCAQGHPSLIIPPGSQFGCFASAIAGAPTFVVTLYVAKLRA